MKIPLNVVPKRAHGSEGFKVVRGLPNFRRCAVVFFSLAMPSVLPNLMFWVHGLGTQSVVAYPPPLTGTLSPFIDLNQGEPGEERVRNGRGSAIRALSRKNRLEFTEESAATNKHLVRQFPTHFLSYFQTYFKFF